jgi:hypothetical protein
MNDILSGTQIAANIATVLGVLGIIFLFVQHYHNRDLRNLQLMHRCIDIFRDWFKNNSKVDFSYLELLNEELFYFQKKLIQKKVAVEWIEGILDFIVIYGKNNVVLNTYNQQTDIEKLADWPRRKMFFARVSFFIRPKLEKNITIPDIEDRGHAKKKRELALALYKHIKNYQY